MTLEEAIAVLKSPEGRDETRRVYRLNRAVEVAVQVITQARSRAEAEQVVEQLASVAEELFPGSADTFAIVYGRKLRRVIRDVFGDGN